MSVPPDPTCGPSPPHHPAFAAAQTLGFFFLQQIYWENAKFQRKKKGLFTHIVT
jgi:hypothetical protein